MKKEEGTLDWTGLNFLPCFLFLPSLLSPVPLVVVGWDWLVGNDARGVVTSFLSLSLITLVALALHGQCFLRYFANLPATLYHYLSVQFAFDLSIEPGIRFASLTLSLFLLCLWYILVRFRFSYRLCSFTFISFGVMFKVFKMLKTLKIRVGGTQKQYC